MHDKSKNLIGLKKAKSLIEKIIKMTEQDEYCIDIIQQNLAVIGLLKAVNLTLLQGHLDCCFVDAIQKNDTQKTQEMIKEMIKVIKIAQDK